MAASASSKFVLNSALKLDTADSLKPHIAALTAPDAATTIKHIDFSGNTLGVPACQALADVLRNLHALEHANFADIFTGRLLSEIPAALDAIVEALLTLKNLRTVNLSDNAFGLNTQAPLVKFLEKAAPLRHLILNNNGLGPEAGTHIANAISKLALAKKASSSSEDQAPLETIICGRNRLENGSMAAWAQAVASHGAGLKEIKMVQNGIRQEGIQALLRTGLRHCKALRTLDLQDNTFTRAGARALAEVVGEWTGLIELGVGDCLLSARGMVAVGEAFEKGLNTNLEVMRLQFDDIDAKGVQAVVVNCDKGTLPKLRRVELNGNKFDEEDPAVERLKEILSERKKAAGKDEDEEDDEWGLDELDELEEPSDGEEEDDDDDEDDEEEKKEEHARDMKQTDQAEAENVVPEKDADIDALADRLNKAL